MAIQVNTAKIDSNLFHQAWSILDVVNHKIFLFKNEEYEQLTYRMILNVIKEFVSFDENFYFVIMNGRSLFNKRYINIEFYHENKFVQMILEPGESMEIPE